MWNLDIAVLAFAVVVIIVILSSQDVGLEIVSPVAVFGLAMVWLSGWRQGKKSYTRFYNEEISRLEYEQMKTIDGTIEDTIQKALRDRFR